MSLHAKKRWQLANRRRSNTRRSSALSRGADWELRFEPLERRDLLASDAVLAAGALSLTDNVGGGEVNTVSVEFLSVMGTPVVQLTDAAGITPDGNEFAVVDANTVQYATADVTSGQIDVMTNAGADSITLVNSNSLNLDIDGGGDSDSISLGSGAVLTGSVDGGAGVDTLSHADGANTWNITGADNGTVTDVSGGFTNVENLTGGAGDDDFLIASGASLTGDILGNGGNNSLSQADGANSWAITGANAGTVTDLGGSFASILTIGGGVGVDSLSGQNAVNNWSLSGGGSGMISGDVIFTGMEDLQGGSDIDFFTIAGSHTGNIAGGDGGDFISLQGGAMLIGSVDGETGSDSLSHVSGANTWNITGADSGTVTGVSSGFSDIENLTGGNASDDFVIGSAGSLSGNLSGWIGADSLWQADGTNSWNLTGSDSGTVTDLGGSFSLIESIGGGTGTDTLTGDNVASTWSVTGSGGGTVGSLAFTGMEDLVGGSAVDTFNISDNHTGDVSGGDGSDIFAFTGSAVLTGSIDGGGLVSDTDTLDLSGYGSSVGVSLTGAGTIKGFMGTTPVASGGFDNISNLDAAGKLSSFTGLNANSKWVIDTKAGTTTYTSGMKSIDISGTTDLNGGTANDDLTIDFSGGGAIPNVFVDFDGGAGPDDSVTITGGSFATVTYNATGPDDGKINLGGFGTVLFDGLEPIDMTGSTATDFIFNLPADGNDAKLSDLGGGMSRLESTNATFELMDFTNPSGSITINGGAGADNISVASLDLTYGGDLIINDDADGAKISLDGKLSIDGKLVVTADLIELNTGFIESMGEQVFNGPVLLGPPTIVMGTNFGAGENITFADTVDSTGTATDLRLFSGFAAAVLFKADVGGSGALAELLVESGTLATKSITTTGNVNLDSENEITIDGAVDAGVGNIRVRANLDNVGAENLTMAVGSSLTTTNESKFAITLSADGIGDVVLRSVSAGTATGRVVIDAGGAILDGDVGTGINITANNARLSAGTVGAAGAGGRINTNIANVEAATTTGGVFLRNNAADLTVGGLIDKTGNLNGISAAGPVNLNVGGKLNVIEDISGSELTITTGETAPANADDDLLIGPGVAVTSNTANITLNVADDFSLDATASINSAGSVTINVDAAGTDNDAAGSTVDFDGSVTATLTSINGGEDDDTFNILPSSTSPFDIAGDLPTSFPGDVLVVDNSGLTSPPTLTIGGMQGSGTYSFNAPDTEQPITFTSIEDANTGGSGPFHLVLDMFAAGFQDGGGDLVELSRSGADLVVDVNGGNVFTGANADVLSFTLLGSTDDDTLRVNETASGLPSFAGTSPDANTHTNQAFLDTVGGAGIGPTNVGIGLVGGAGGATDRLEMNFLTSQDVSYFSDNDTAANSGVVNVDGEFTLSFTSLTPMSFTGAGGSLAIDASSTPATSTITISEGVAAADGVSRVTGNGGFETVDFSGFGSLSILGGGGAAETINLVSLDSVSPPTSVVLDGDNTTDTDNSGDTLRVQSTPSGVAVTLRGGGGNDAFNIFSTSSKVDGIQGTVNVSPAGDEGGVNDRLTIIDSADGTADTVNINSTTIDGIFDSGSGTDVTYNPDNLDSVSVTTSGMSDTINLDFLGLGGADIDLITVNGSSGADDFNILSDTFSGATTNLNGNAGVDEFIYAAGAFVVTGNIDGGTAIDSIDYSAYSLARELTIDALGSVDGFQGRDTSAATSLTGTFDNIDDLIGTGASDTLIGPDLRNRWDIDSTNNGTLIADNAVIFELLGYPVEPSPAVLPAQESLTWTSWENLIGAATSDDWFDLRNGAGLSGFVDGRGGEDSLDYGDYKTAIFVDLSAIPGAGFQGVATNIGGDIVAGTGGGNDGSSIENVFGGAGNDNAGGMPGIIGDQDGNILGDGFGHDFLDGRGGNDTFRMIPGIDANMDDMPDSGASSRDIVIDIAGNDTIDFLNAFQADSVMGFDGAMIDMDLNNIPQDVQYFGGAPSFVELRKIDPPQGPLDRSPFENFAGSAFADRVDIDPEPFVLRNVNGREPDMAPGDVMQFDAGGQSVIDTGFSITADGVGVVTYQNLETIIGQNQAPRVIDNGEIGFYENSPATPSFRVPDWITAVDQGYNGDFSSGRPDGDLNTAVWNFDGLMPGRYRVSATWPEVPNAHVISKSALFRAYDNDAEIASATVDQSIAPNDFTTHENGQTAAWEVLFDIDINSHYAAIELANSQSAYVMADAIRFELLSTSGPELTVLDGDRLLSDGVSTVVMETTLGTALVKSFTIRNDGDADLEIFDVVLVGDDANYTLTPPNSTTLAPGEATFFTVSLDGLNALDMGDFPIQVQIETNDADENVFQKAPAGINPPSFDLDLFSFELRSIVSNRLILDDGDPGFTLFGDWLGPDGDGFQGDDRWTVADGDGERAVWRFDDLPDGTYRVSTTWHTHATALSPSVPYRVLDINGELTTVSVNQQMAPDDFSDAGANWEDLGTLDLTGGSLIVELLDTATLNKSIVADAVRIERIFDPDIRVLDGATEVIDDTGLVQFGPTLPGQPVTKVFDIFNDSATNSVEISEPVSLPAGFTLVDTFGFAPDGTQSILLGPGGSTSITVRFEAGLPGVASGEISFPTNLDPDENPFNFRVTGEANPARIIDNSDSNPEFALTGAWEGPDGHGFLGNDTWKDGDGSGGTATWSFTNLPDAYYRVSATWKEEPTAGAATNAPFTVTISGSPTVVEVDQTLPPDDFGDENAFWEDLGVFRIVDGVGAMTVSLSDPLSANGIVIADAVRIEMLVHPEIEVEESGNVLVDEVSTIDFGTVAVGGSADVSLTIRNYGVWPLAMGDIVLPAGFSISVPGNFDVPIPVDGSRVVTLSLDTSAAGMYSGTVRLANDDIDENTFDIFVRGQVVDSATIIDDGDIEFAQTSGWITSPTTGFMGDVRFIEDGAGAETTSWTFTGLTPNTIVRLSATWPANSGLASNAPYTISGIAGGPTTVLVDQRIAPNDFSDAGAIWLDLGLPVRVDGGGTVTVTLSDDANGWVVADAVRLETLPMQPEIEVIDVTTANEVSDGTGLVVLPPTSPGTPITRTFDVNNLGNAPLNLAGISLPVGYSLVSGFSINPVPPGSTSTFTVQLDAAIGGTFGGQIAFHNDDLDESPFNFTITGNVSQPLQIIDDGDAGFSAPSFSLAPGQGFMNDVRYAPGANNGLTATWNFGGLTPGATYEVFATWTPQGNRATNAPYEISGVVGGPTTVPTNQRLTPDDTTALGRPFELLGAFQTTGASLTVTLGDDADGFVIADAILVREVTVPGPEIHVTQGATTLSDGASLVDFGTTMQGTPVPLVFTVYNMGGSTLELESSISLPAGFSLAASLGSTSLAPGASTTFSVELSAAAVGSFSGQVVLGNTDADEGPFEFYVEGVVEKAITIIDNTDAGFSSSGFVFFSGQGIGGNLEYAAGNNSGDSASWTFSGLTPGDIYEVAATWSRHRNRATDAPYTVSGVVGGPTTVDVNQEQSPGSFHDQGVGWESLGLFEVDGGGTLVVTLTDDANEFVIADAIRIELIDEPEIAVDDGVRNVPDGTGVVNFGPRIMGSAPIKTITVANQGGADLIVQPITMPAGFLLASPNFAPNTIITPGASLSFDVQLDTTSLGLQTGLLAFGDNDADESPFEFTLTGLVVADTTPLIVDNLDDDFSQTGFLQFDNQGFASSVHFTAGDSTGDTATWTFSGLPSGTYRVSTTWHAQSNRATDAMYMVSGITGGPFAVPPINQETSPQATAGSFLDQGVYWVDLGGPHASTGGDLTVTLSDMANEFVIADAVRIERLGPQMASAGLAIDHRNQPALTYDQVEPLLAAAIDRWQTVEPGMTNYLSSAQVIIGDLPGATLGLASFNTPTIWIDSNAAGHGWYLDATPAFDEEFGGGMSIGGRYDLLSVLTHELGHLQGLRDVDVDHAHGGLLAGSLDAGVRSTLAPHSTFSSLTNEISTNASPRLGRLAAINLLGDPLHSDSIHDRIMSRWSDERREASRLDATTDDGKIRSYREVMQSVELPSIAAVNADDEGQDEPTYERSVDELMSAWEELDRTDNA
ncbi:MAG: choice-of-anchor D domain-containing protein [Planctomycetales bacterium]|nr:choice-of-anchor D domain-containing protein [Planctomycetales bacterium]